MDTQQFCNNIYGEIKKPWAFGICRAKYGAKSKKPISALFAHINLDEGYCFFAALMEVFLKNNIIIDEAKKTSDNPEMIVGLNKECIADVIKFFGYTVEQINKEGHKNLQTLTYIYDVIDNSACDDRFEIVALFEDSAPKTLQSSYLKLYLLSQKKVGLKSINLSGIFSILPNVAWDIFGNAYELDWLRENEIRLKFGEQNNYPNIVSVDKFPRFLSHIIPEDNTRILDSAKVRMGAVLAAGTTVMPGAAYINFNSGTTGAVMVEGRISSSVVVGEGSDVGGGASILGVLSGTNGNAVSIGKRCLLGANSVTGIPLGNDCIVDAGLAILEGTKVYISENDIKLLKDLNKDFKFDKEVYKALELANLHGMHFRMNSQTGQITCSFSKRAIKLNSILH